MSQTMLKLRAEISKRRPAFPRNKSGHRMNLRVSSWRKPKGKHTKLRLHKGSRLPLVKDGFRGPAVVRGVHNSGLQMVLVHNMPQLLALKAGEHTAIIADVGQRKKYDLAKKASELNIALVNVKSIQKFLDTIEKDIKVRKHQRSEYVKSRTKKAETKKEEKKQEKIESKPGKSETNLEVNTEKKVVAESSASIAPQGKSSVGVTEIQEAKPEVKTEKSRAEILKEQQAKADLSKPKLRDAGEKK